MCAAEVIQVYHLFLPCRTVISALVKMMKEKKWAHRVLRKQGQTCYSHGPSGGERKAKAVNWVQFFFFSYQCSPCSSQMWCSKPKGFLTHLLSIFENGTFITSQVEMLESLLKGAFLGGFQLHFL